MTVARRSVDVNSARSSGLTASQQHFVSHMVFGIRCQLIDLHYINLNYSIANNPCCIVYYLPISLLITSDHRYSAYRCS